MCAPEFMFFLLYHGAKAGSRLWRWSGAQLSQKECWKIVSFRQGSYLTTSSFAYEALSLHVPLPGDSAPWPEPRELWAPSELGMAPHREALYFRLLSVITVAGGSSVLLSESQVARKSLAQGLDRTLMVCPVRSKCKQEKACEKGLLLSFLSSQVQVRGEEDYDLWLCLFWTGGIF